MGNGAGASCVLLSGTIRARQDYTVQFITWAYERSYEREAQKRRANVKVLKMSITDIEINRSRFRGGCCIEFLQEQRGQFVIMLKRLRTLAQGGIRKHQLPVGVFPEFVAFDRLLTELHGLAMIVPFGAESGQPRNRNEIPLAQSFPVCKRPIRIDVFEEIAHIQVNGLAATPGGFLGERLDPVGVRREGFELLYVV